LLLIAGMFISKHYFQVYFNFAKLTKI